MHLPWLLSLVNPFSLVIYALPLTTFSCAPFLFDHLCNHLDYFLSVAAFLVDSSLLSHLLLFRQKKTELCRWITPAGKLISDKLYGIGRSPSCLTPYL